MGMELAFKYALRCQPDHALVHDQPFAVLSQLENHTKRRTLSQHMIELNNLHLRFVMVHFGGNQSAIARALQNQDGQHTVRS